MNNLKPCPFCGNVDITNFVLPAAQSPTGEPAYTNNCPECGASTAGFATQEDADAAWNQRVKGN